MNRLVVMAQDAQACEVIDNQLESEVLPPQHEGYLALRAMGANQSHAAVMAGYSKAHGVALERKLNPKDNLMSRKFVRLAGDCVRNVLSGTPWGTIEKIKDSSALAAAQMVYDRVQPVVHHTQAVNLNIDLDPVDIERFRCK